MVSFPFTSLPVVFLIIISLGSTSLANFYSDFDITWGDNRGKILDNGNLLTLSLDNSSGAGFKSRNDYLFGNISMQLKLIRGNTVGTVTTFYLSSEGSKWDEVDFEFLGNLSGEPYILHTNVFTQGVGGKEQQFYLWFDPTADFHTYSFIWNPKRILFFVDGIPIREFKNIESIGVPFPKNQPMKVQCSLWHSNTWATRGGRLKTDWSLAPFTASYKNFEADACVVYSGLSSCAAPANSFGDPHWVSEQLGEIGHEKLRRVQKKYMIYDYCSDHKRFTQGFPTECRFLV